MEAANARLMKVTVENQGPCRKRLKIELPAERVAAEFDEVLKAYSRSARVPGFRPGKAPSDLIQKRYGREMAEDVRERLIPDAYHEALVEQKIDPVATLAVENVSFGLGQPLSFSVLVDVPPEFSLPEYNGIPLQRKGIEVKDDEASEMLRGMLEERATWDAVSGRTVQKGDLVQIDYEGVCAGQPLENLAPKAAGLGAGKDFWTLADENEFLPGMAAGLVGAAIGEKRQVLVDFPADFAEKDLAGRKCTYFVDVKAIREKKPAVMDETFFKGLGVTNEDELKARIRDDLRRLREDMESRRLRVELIRHLLDHTRLDVPESVVQRETQDVVYDLVRSMSSRGASSDDIRDRKLEIFESAGRTASEKIKTRYILHRIAEKESVQAGDEEVAARIAEMAARHRMPPAELRAELEKNDALDGVVEEVRLSKILNLLFERAKISGA